MTDGLSEAYDMKKWDVFCENNDLLFENDQLKADNAKLRELVLHLRECTRHNVCAACKYADDACDFDYDMRELGVDFDG